MTARAGESPSCGAKPHDRLWPPALDRYRHRGAAAHARRKIRPGRRFCGRVAQAHTPLSSGLRPPGAPDSPDALLQRILRRATPAIGYHLFGESFGGHPPDRPKRRRKRPEPDIATLVDATDLIDRLGRIADAAAPADGPTVSLIICTRDRPEQLAACLRSVRALRCPPEEVIVVDNAPSDGATAAVAREYSDIRYLVEPKPGLSAARNTGVAAASGEVIAFTDDDVVVTDNWIAQLKQAFADPRPHGGLRVDVAAGARDSGAGGFPVAARSGIFDTLPADSLRPGVLRGLARPRGSLLAHRGRGEHGLRRKVFDRVGLFDERLGAGAAGCSEDSEMWYRILASGHSCHYEPSCVVRHKHRRTMGQARSQAYLYMRGHVMALVVQAIEHRHLGNLNRLFVRLPWYYLRQLLGTLWRGFGIDDHFTVSEMAGVVAGLFYAIGHIWLPKHRAYARLRAALAPAE